MIRSSETICVSTLNLGGWEEQLGGRGEGVGGGVHGLKYLLLTDTILDYSSAILDFLFLPVVSANLYMYGSCRLPFR